jgi:hypothetical protein
VLGLGAEDAVVAVVVLDVVAAVVAVEVTALVVLAVVVDADECPPIIC